MKSIDSYLSFIRQSKGYRSRYPIYAPIIDTGGQALNSLMLGLVADGKTDNTAAFKKAFEISSKTNRPILMAPGQYVSSWLYSPYMPHIWAEPGTVQILASNAQDSTWNFGVTAPGPSILLAIDALKNTTTITGVDTSTLIADDLVMFVTNATDNGTAFSQTVRVLRVDSATQMTLAEPLYADFTVAQSGRVRRLPRGQSGGFLRGLEFKSIAPSTGVGGFLTFWHARDFDIDFKGEGAGGPGITVQSCYDFRIKHKATKYFDKGVTGLEQFGYGVNVSGASAHGDVHVLADQVRHAVSTNGTPNNIKFTGVAHSCTNTAWDAHQGGVNIVFDHCMVYGGNGFGFALRGKRQHVNGGNVDQAYGGVFIFDSPGGNEVKGLRVSNTRDSGDGNTGNGIVISKTMAALTVEGCEFHNLARSAISHRAGTITTPRIANNHAVNVGMSQVANERNLIRQLSAASMVDGEIVGNSLKDNQAASTAQYGIQLAGTSNSGLLVRGNSLNGINPANAFNGVGIAASTVTGNFVNNELV